MPRVATGAVQPAAAEAYAQLNRASLRSLHSAGIIAARGQLEPADVVVARIARYLYWSGPAVSAPGSSERREEMRRITVSVADRVRTLVRRSSVPQRIVVSLDDGSVRTMDDPGDPVNVMFGRQALPGVWISVPLQQWCTEAKALPTGPEREVGS